MVRILLKSYHPWNLTMDGLPRYSTYCWKHRRVHSCGSSNCWRVILFSFWVWYITIPLRKLATNILYKSVVLRVCLNIYLKLHKVRIPFFYILGKCMFSTLQSTIPVFSFLFPWTFESSMSQNAYLVSMKCEGSNNFSNSECLLSQRCLLLCASCGEYKVATTCEDFKFGALMDFFFHSGKFFVSKEWMFTKYNTLMYVQTYIFLRYACSPLIETVWSTPGTLVLWMDQVQILIHIFIYIFSNSGRLGTFEKLGDLIENRARQLQQYLFGDSTQHAPLFLIIMLHWTIEVNLTQYFYWHFSRTLIELN